MRNLITGGAGFLGSHLVDYLMNKGEDVICLDNFSTGSKDNIALWIGNNRFKLINQNIIYPFFCEADRIWHLACPASPLNYLNKPIETLNTIFLGTDNILKLSKKINARILIASTSEIYGNPKISPQKETYNGSVNPISKRSCYVEGKRVAETLSFEFKRIHNIDLRLVRIFNTYGPRMMKNDGRVVSNFIYQGLNNKPLTIYGNGLQTRSFCYVDDMIAGLSRAMNSNYSHPINLGNPEEITIKNLAQKISLNLNKKLNLQYLKLPEDDPIQRKPCIEVAIQELKWQPKISLNNGLDKTIHYFVERFKNER
ncbi:Nucleoside-diphosphate-sugar epimerase [Prochlorococcus marinus subsp. pastoris str. CCMP1986]|uniref:Nucleoside-diphosphate-sugar epimerase n=1 Tax=Prochlorococcus marinus subsp. pastoris (strain CCMP1986 / NIES-2087 / MED4) TaxID=59919 RepID=Q7V0J6_PROMP|nr:UDP-glucuronic acid decarboxylase family protein [Prochlorococcus marinus]KGF87177.1 dTDP-glucose 4,6-dehydratase [Prochlorococcus marinus str. EQPAC1]CAE19719.1 Nucleoside-diphosphate-sugar epimerase [Prochlorococcus marinus subsp. pastoris str. CCMP1986]